MTDQQPTVPTSAWTEGERVTVSGPDVEPFEGTIAILPRTDDELRDNGVDEQHWDQLRTVIVSRDDGRTLGVPASYLSKQGD